MKSIMQSLFVDHMYNHVVNLEFFFSWQESISQYFFATKQMENLKRRAFLFFSLTFPTTVLDSFICWNFLCNWLCLWTTFNG